MAFYLSVPVSDHGIADYTGKVELIDLRTDASALLYGDAAYLQGMAQDKWADLDWQIERVSSRRYLVKGESKRRD